MRIKSNIKSYDVFFEKDSSFLDKLFEKENSIFIVDKNVYNLHNNKFLQNLPSEKLIILDACEENKSIETLCYLYENIMKFAPRKNLTIIAIGGGITQDVAGFVASTLYRGVNWIFIPTTLLAQSDSCIGAKTSINFKHYKNLVGSFYPATEIHIFPEFLKTLKKEDLYSGIGEIAKLHLMDGEKSTNIFIKSLPLIDKLDNDALLHVIKKCLEIKKSYIEQDEFDTGKRNMLNFGHCFGHAIESASDFNISHGQAVVLGMILANKYALKHGYLSEEKENFILENVLKPSLIADVPEMDIDKVISAMQQDKKNTGKGLALVMLNDDWEMIKIVDMQEIEAKKVLEKYLIHNKIL